MPLKKLLRSFLFSPFPVVVAPADCPLMFYKSLEFASDQELFIDVHETYLTSLAWL
jgi:hypothetical protein